MCTSEALASDRIYPPPKGGGFNRRLPPIGKVFVLLTLLLAIAGCVGQNDVSNLSERPDYNLSSDVFSELPEFPSDFYEIDRSVSILSFDYEELNNLEESYYKQPEFYPTWEGIGVNLMKNPDENRVGLWGFGAYPAEGKRKVSAGDNFTNTAFFHTSWMVVTYQGIKFVPDYDDRYFDVFIEPEGFVLGPAYPIFKNEWVKKADVKIQVKQGTPNDTYEIKLYASQPDPADENKWRNVFGGKYVNAPTAQPDRPMLRIEVMIE